MSALFQIEHADQREQPETLASVMLTEQLTKYQLLRREEKKLRGRVEFLEKQAALRGFLQAQVDAATVDAATLLQEEKSQLEALREEVEQQEDQLKKLEELSPAQRTNLEIEHLEQLLSDLKAKRAQLRIYHSNLLYLEEKQAQLGLEARVDLANELKLTQTELEKIRVQRQQLENTLKAAWQFDPNTVPDFDALEAKQIKTLAKEILARHQAQAEAQIQARLESAAQKYHDLVVAELEALRQTAYADSTCQVTDKLPKTDIVEWKLTCVGSFGGVTVSVEFDPAERGDPAHFKCVRYLHDGRIGGQSNAGFSRTALREALQALHQKNKKWWQWW